VAAEAGEVAATAADSLVAAVTAVVVAPAVVGDSRRQISEF
jgi:hypothetical protein